MAAPHVQSLVYSMVARGELMLSHYSAFPSTSASFAALAAACLPKLSADASSSSQTVHSYKCDGYTFHFLLQDGFTYLVVSSNLEGDEIASTFLQCVKEKFHKQYGGATIDNERIMASNLDKDFGPKLKEHMQHCLDNSQNLKKLASVKDRSLEVKKTVTEKIEKVLESEQSVHLRVESLDVLHAHVENFHRQGQQLKRKMQIRQIKLRLLVLFISIIVSIGIWLIICKGVEC